jgi:hypothetical protein
MVSMMMKTEIKMTKEYDINEAVEAFKARTKAECPDAAYAYQAGYFETVLRGLLECATDQVRELVLDQLIGKK